MAIEGGKKSRRDRLKAIEEKAQKLWEENGVFRAESCEKPPEPGEKFFGNFPLPYMNGFLHLGHAFSLSKLEFSARFHRLRGAHVLLPVGFHLTGMPIKSIGLSAIDISELQNPSNWLSYFPRVAVKELKAFGLGCDWRRSFITTDMNPYFDKFLRWQMRKLKSMGKIVKDIRYTIYSPLDGQPCADHDRATGEGVRPQEYTIIKMEVVAPFPPKLGVLKGKKVFLAAATLRPETSYGQTNAWVLPDGKYGAFEINETDVFILTQRAALNLAYQKYSRVPEKPSCLVEMTGYDLIGLPLKSPLALNQIVYALPMLTVLTDKGTGILTSVPSDAPDDYMALEDLKLKPAFREKYGVKDEWVMPFDIIPIIKIPEYGDKAAKKVVEDLKIKSQNEIEKLAEAKRLTSLKGLTEGKLLVGEFKERIVQEAKPLIRSRLLEAGDAIMYSEPEKQVVSRSGDECVVALIDQWCITYGEAEWKKTAQECLSCINLYSDTTRHGFVHTLNWLSQWACSRSFGLGTRIPWDEEYLVEPLSDSTLYMAYYTIAHLLHNEDMYGSSNSTSAVRAEQMTDEVWDFIFCDGSYPQSSDITPSILNKMKQEFEYWYPFDLEVSGKDLIQNHTFCIYNHTALLPKKHWPSAFRCNGHLMLKSTKNANGAGNFISLRHAIDHYSADATRFALADISDGIDDAYFSFETANAAIVRLTKEIDWIDRMKDKDLGKDSSLRIDSPCTFSDRVFLNEINIAVKRTEQNYQGCMFREALKTGFYDLQAARDWYRISCGGTNAMNHDLVWRFIDVQTRLIAPICPHYAEHVWRELLEREGFAVNAGWPAADAPDLTLQSANKYLQDSIDSIRKLHNKQLPTSKKTNMGASATSLTEALIYVKEKYDGWKAECLRILQHDLNRDTLTSAHEDKEIFEALKASSFGQDDDFSQKNCMEFLKFKKEKAVALGIQALDLKLPFGEIEVLEQNLDLIKKQIHGLEEVQVLSAINAADIARAGPHARLLEKNPPSPGSPTTVFLTR
ncbi:leucine--tRNA ligase, cytoplasmic-like [Rosa rugosa]|uniref:leucine--tRNA ligase, cytoplasmic-like n=1 Tax=Rosa rugosa TaxID=74645 RepID=UPI002B40FAD9|nr:leucine--tRNA ligase, cytoplasmic-like [Rosa rugosa]